MIEGANPNWNFKGDPSFVWTDAGLAIIYTDDYVEGSSHVDGISTITGVPSKWNALIDDLYNRTGWLKAKGDLTGNRGYLKNITINASRALTLADAGLINVYSAAFGSAQTGVVELTLPGRAEIKDAGNGYFNSIASSPFMQPLGQNLPIFTINGYTNNAGVPLKITVNQTSVVSPGVDVDMQQSIVIGDITGQSIWLYSGEYAELLPIIIRDDATGTYFMIWVVQVHNSGYQKVGQYVQNPVGVVHNNQLRANNASKSRAAYPRLWKALDTGGVLNPALVAQGSKTNDKFGTGDGSTTFTLPSLAALEASLVYWCLYF